MRGDPPPFARIGMELFATAFRLGGVILSCLSLLGTLILGFDSVFEPPDWQTILALAGIFLGTHAFGLVCYEFGKAMFSNRLPVPPRKVGVWLLCRFLFSWLFALLAPLVLFAGKQLYLCDLSAVPASLAAIACLWAANFLERQIRHLERTILPGQIEPETASPEDRIRPDPDP